MVSKNNLTSIHYKQLSILISQDGFFFYLEHTKPELTQKKEFILIDDILNINSLNLFQQSLKDICDQFSFKSIKVAFSDANYSLVPEVYYKEDFKADYLKYNVQLFEEDQISSDFIEVINAYQVYIPLMNYHNLILDMVGEFEYQHFTNFLIKKSKPKLTSNLQVINVFISNSLLDIVAFDGQKFKLCNTFFYETDYDLVYYILFAVEELNFDQRQMHLHLYHNQNKISWLDILKDYILNIDCNKKAIVSFIE